MAARTDDKVAVIVIQEIASIMERIISEISKELGY